MAQVVQVDAMMIVEACIEGRMHLDKTGVAVKHHMLTQGHAAGAIEAQIEVAKINACRRMDICSGGRIAFDVSLYADRFRA